MHVNITEHAHFRTSHTDLDITLKVIDAKGNAAIITFTPDMALALRDDLIREINASKDAAATAWRKGWFNPNAKKVA